MIQPTSSCRPLWKVYHGRRSPARDPAASCPSDCSEGGDGCVQAVQCRHRWWCAALQVQLAEPLAAEPLAAALQVPLAQVPLAAVGR